MWRSPAPGVQTRKSAMLVNPAKTDPSSTGGIHLAYDEIKTIIGLDMKRLKGDAIAYHWMKCIFVSMWRQRSLRDLDAYASCCLLKSLGSPRATSHPCPGTSKLRGMLFFPALCTLHKEGIAHHDCSSASLASAYNRINGNTESRPSSTRRMHTSASGPAGLMGRP